MYQRIRPYLFRMDPERAHDLTVRLLQLVGRFPFLGRAMRGWVLPAARTEVEFCGLRFPHPIGLAAGYDKDGLAWRGLAALGFGHIEVGTVTPEPQAGNPRPRIFRVPEDGAVINRMGFPGRGSDFFLRQVAPRGIGGLRDQVILGINIGKNRSTPLEEAVNDYVFLLRELAPTADYFAVNVSSPNTIGLRRLQARDHLENLLDQLSEERSQLMSEPGLHLPILVKLAPDLTDQELDDALEAVLNTGTDGVIATNTTVTRPSVENPVYWEEGGLSGRPLKDLSTEMVKKITRRTDGELPVIGVGGVETGIDAREKLAAGAGLVQVYTGLIYRGPLLVRHLLEEI